MIEAMQTRKVVLLPLIFSSCIEARRLPDFDLECEERSCTPRGDCVRARSGGSTSSACGSLDLSLNLLGLGLC